MNERLLERMKSCSILNGYDGLSDLEQYARETPEGAFEIAWEILCYKEDPGRDDGALCVELTKICVDAIGGDSYARAIREAWETIPDGIRMNVIEGFVNEGMNKNVVLDLFNSTKSSVAERHRILSLVASARFDEFRGDMVEMISSVGEYDDENRQAGLDRLVNGIAGML